MNGTINLGRPGFYRDPRGFEGDPEDVLKQQLQQTQQIIDTLYRAAEDLDWAARNAAMTDALTLSDLDGEHRDPLLFYHDGDEYAAVRRFHGAAAAAEHTLEEINRLRRRPLSDVPPIQGVLPWAGTAPLPAPKTPANPAKTQRGS